MKKIIGDKQEMIDGYSTIMGKFHRNHHYDLLKKIVKKSKDIPDEYRINALNY